VPISKNEPLGYIWSH